MENPCYGGVFGAKGLLENLQGPLIEDGRLLVVPGPDLQPSESFERQRHAAVPGSVALLADRERFLVGFPSPVDDSIRLQAIA